MHDALGNVSPDQLAAQETTGAKTTMASFRARVVSRVLIAGEAVSMHVQFLTNKYEPQTWIRCRLREQRHRSCTQKTVVESTDRRDSEI